MAGDGAPDSELTLEPLPAGRPAAAGRQDPPATRPAGKTAPRPAAAPEPRLASLDAYRGLIMIALAFGGFGLAETAQRHVQAGTAAETWTAVRYQFSHAEWVGCAFWDLIQPSFMFMVGVAMAFSYARRQQRGHSYRRMLGHAVWRSLVLVLLGVFLTSNWSATTQWSFANVLCQIGLGYTFLFLLWGRRWRVQAIAAAVILLGTWLLYVTYPQAGLDFQTAEVDAGVSQAWAAEHLDGIPPAWHKNANVGHAVDLWLLNQFPREAPFEFNRGGYQTINFIPSLATMLFGLMCGRLLRGKRSAWAKLGILLLAGGAGLAAGWLLNESGICPLVKRIWTPSWALFSTGWCCLFLAILYAGIDGLRLRILAWPAIVVGMNSLAMYCMGQLLKPWTRETLQRHLGRDIFLLAGEVYEPMLQATCIGLVFWLVCLWLYRQKFFLRI